MIEQTLFPLGGEADFDLDRTGGMRVALDERFASAARIQLDDTSWVEHVQGWLSGDGELMEALMSQASWEQRSRWMYTRMVTEPRLTAEYPVTADAPQPVLHYLTKALSAHYRRPYTRLWMNWYRDNGDGTGWHADRPANQQDEAVIPVLSLGATRRFLIRPAGGGPSTAIVAHGGDLVVMGGRCQKDYQHSVPKQKQSAGARLSLNFSIAVPAALPDSPILFRTEPRPRGYLTGNPAMSFTGSVSGMVTQEAEGSPPGRPLTARGAATRDRIVQAAADLMYVKGVNATTLDDIRAVTGTSKSQLYRHFPDKDALIHAVIALRGQQVLDRETQRLGKLSSFSGLTRWRDALIRVNSLQNGAYGCALGSMASELADQDEQARTSLAQLFTAWEELLAAGLRRMQAKGTLSPDADAGQQAVALMAAVQGGYLLASAAHDIRPMEIALDLALAHLKSYLTDPGEA